MSTALYRRYRPDTFAEVIGQEHVTAPLVTALGKDAVSHAYLFSGPRGCGKTTSARILARCLNCAQGPTGEPCGQCDSCRDLATGGSGSLDVIEIDAASHGGVDDARDLRERATFAPVRDRYKIFIIDEAHMVTAAGFNALLKIVEEPPEHIKFIFATTEPDKVIGTIRSRTHHYPFRLVPPEPLLHYLERLCAAEGVAAAPGVLQLVLRAGGGSVRDTLSVLDQLIAGAGESGVDYDRATALLGFTHAALLDEVIDAAAALDGAKAFSVVDRVVQSGQDPRRFVEDLLERQRDLIIVKSVPDSPQAILRGVPEDQIRIMQAQAQKVGAAELSRAADITAAALTEMVGATSPRLHLELLMARLLLPHADSGHASLAARLERLERRLDFTTGAGSTPAGEAPAEIASPSAHQPAPSSAPRSPDAQDPQPAPPEPEPRTPPESEPPSATEPQQAPPHASPPPSAADEWAAPGVPRNSAAPSWTSTPQTDESPVGPEPTPPSAPQAPGAPHEASSETEESRPPEESAAPTTQVPAAGSGSTEMMNRAWPDIVEAMKTRSRMLWMLVKGNVSVAGFNGETLTLAFSNDGARSTFANRNGEQALGEAIQEVLGMQVSFELASGPPPGGAGPPKAEGRAEAPAPAPLDPATAEGADSPPHGAPADHPADAADLAPPEDPEDDPGPWPEDRWDAPAPEGAWQSPRSSPDPSPSLQHAQSEPEPTGTPPRPPIPVFARRASTASPSAEPAATQPTPPTPPVHGRAAEIRQRLAARSAAPAPADALGRPAQEAGEDPYESSPPPDWAETAAEAESDIPRDDDADLEGSGVFGRRAIERILGGDLLEERRLDREEAP